MRNTFAQTPVPCEKGKGIMTILRAWRCAADARRIVETYRCELERGSGCGLETKSPRERGFVETLSRGTPKYKLVRGSFDAPASDGRCLEKECICHRHGRLRKLEKMRSRKGSGTDRADRCDNHFLLRINPLSSNLTALLFKPPFFP